jgi:hypothetical protein
MTLLRGTNCSAALIQSRRTKAGHSVDMLSAEVRMKPRATIGLRRDYCGPNTTPKKKKAARLSERPDG